MKKNILLQTLIVTFVSFIIVLLITHFTNYSFTHTSLFAALFLLMYGVSIHWPSSTLFGRSIFWHNDQNTMQGIRSLPSTISGLILLAAGIISYFII